MDEQNQAYKNMSASGSQASHGEPDKQHVVEELTEAVGNADQPLVRATTFWPFTLYPDTLTLDRTKLSITKRDMFKVAEVQSIRIEDILNVTANVDMFFGSISIATRFFTPDKPFTVRFFKRADALKIKRIAQGYLIARQQNIDCSGLSNVELGRLLDKLGHVPIEDKV